MKQGSKNFIMNNLRRLWFIGTRRKKEKER